MDKQQIYDACEELFTNNSEQLPIQDIIVKCLNYQPLNLHERLLNNLVITGGSTLLNGFGQRLNSELLAKKIDKT